MKNKGILSLFICLVMAASAQAYSPEYDQNGELTLLQADRNRDGYINIADISHFASAWLEQDCGLSNPCEGADIFPEGGDGVVDFRDFAVLANFYGDCTDPNNPNCIHVPLTLYEPPTQDFYLLEDSSFLHVLDLAYPPALRGLGRIELGSPLPSGRFVLQGAKPLLPSLPGVGDNVLAVSAVEREDPGGVFTPGRRCRDFGDAIGNYNFKVTIDGVVAGKFTAADGLSIEQEVVEYQNGDDVLVGKRLGRGTYDDQVAKPLVPILPKPDALIQQVGDLLKTSTMTVTDDTDYPYNYGGQGTRSLVSGGGGHDPTLANQYTLEPDDWSFNEALWPGDSFGTFGNQVAKPLLPSLPGYVTDISSLVLEPFYDLSAQGWDGFITDDWEALGGSGWGTRGWYTVSFGTYGNQGAKPLLPSLPQAGGIPRSCTFYESGCPTTVDFVFPFQRSSPGASGGQGASTSDSRLLGPHPTTVSGFAGPTFHFSGEVCQSTVDMHIASRGPDFIWGRIYRSRTEPNSVIGKGWDHSYNIYLKQYGANLVLHGDGRRDVFYNQDDGTWAREGFFRELTQEVDESFTLTFPHKGTWKFHPLDEPNVPGKISAITDRNGNSMIFDYDTLGRLITIHDALDNPEHGREITIAYNASGHIESVTDWAERQVKYEYYAIGDPNGSVGDLKSVTTPAVVDTPTGNNFPDGKTTTYTYSRGFADERLNHNLLTITNPKGDIQLQNTYGTDPNDPNFDHVIQQNWGDSNAVMHFTYVQEEAEPNNSYAVTRTIVKDFVGNVAEHFYDNRNRLVILRQYTGRADSNLPTSIDPNVNMPVNKLRTDDPAYFETKFEYNNDSLLTDFTYPNGNKLQFVYDETNTNPCARGNLLQHCTLPGPLSGDQSEICESFEYESSYNKVTKRTDPCGSETLCDYDPNGNRIQMTYVRTGPDPNIVYQWQYNEHGQLTASILPDNGNGHQRRDTYAYYSNPGESNYGFLQNIIVDVNSLALTTSFEYDDVGNLTGLTDPRGYDTKFIVNELNQVVRRISREVTASSGVRYQRDYYYDENNNIVQIDVQNKDDQGILQTNENFTTIYEYDTLNYPTSVEAEVDTTKTVRGEFEYDDNRNLTLIRSGEAVNGSEPNNVICYLFDERNLLFHTIRAEGDPDQSTTQYDYDGNGNLKKVSQGLASPPHISTYEYDGFNRIIEANDPMGNVVEYHYNSVGNIVSMHAMGELVDNPNDTNNVLLYTSGYEYDSLNRLIRTEVSHFDPNTQAPIGDGNTVTQFYYNDDSQLTSFRNDNGNVTQFDYDTAGRLNLVTDAKGNTTTYNYDENSNITAFTEVERSDLEEPNETFVTTYQYDNLDRLIRVIDNNDNNTDFACDSRGNRTRITNALSNESRYEYDGLNRLIRTIRDMDSDGADPSDANDIVTSRTWDDNSQLVSQTDDNGNTTTYEYDALNRRTRITYADETNRQLVYDVHDNIVHTTDAIGSVVNYTYDLLGRLTGKTIIPGTGVSSDTTFENYNYDGLSRLVYAQDDDSVVTFSYDSLSNVISETLNSQTVVSVHDGLGNKLSCSYPGGRGITRTYDGLNRIRNNSDGTDSVATYDYIGPERVERLSFGNNPVCDYTYDNVKRIIGTTHSADMNIVDERTYLWDETYNKTQRKDVRTGGPELTHDYTYDAIDRLVYTKVTDMRGGTIRETDYYLDGVGNRTEVTGSPDPGFYTMDLNTPEPADYQMNQYTTTPFDSRLYDKNGNLTTIDNGEPNQKDITYDYRNQMVEFNDTSTGQIHTYAYDALGRRIKKVIDSNGTPQTTHYLYDGLRVIEEQDGDSNTIATYVYGNNINEVLNMQRDSNDYYYHMDDFYNVMAITNGSGIVVERYEYQDNGEPDFFDGTGTSISGTAIGNPYLFTGRRYDPETGWYYYSTRYLEPRSGRFTSR